MPNRLMATAQGRRRCGLAVVLFLMAAAGWTANSARAAEGDADLPPISDGTRLISLHGTVVDPQGRPEPGIRVSQMGFSMDPPPVAITDADGKFELSVRTIRQQSFELLATTADGSRQGFVEVQATYEGVEAGASIEIGAAREFSVVVVDQQGRPSPETHVGLQTTNFHEAHATTDANGSATLKIPTSMAPQCAYAVRPGHGFDYLRFDTPLDSPAEGVRLPADHSGAIGLKLRDVYSVRVRVVDELGAPVAGVSASPWYFELAGKGGNANIGHNTPFRDLTDEQGWATLRAIPVENQNDITIWTRKAPAFASPKRTTLSAERHDTELQATIVHRCLISGQAAMPNGDPAADATIRISGDNHGTDSFRETAICDSRGRFRTYVDFGRVYMMTAELGSFLSDPVLQTILPGQQVEPFQFQLTPGALIRGTLTAGEGREPVPNASVMLVRSLPEANQIPDADKLAANEDGELSSLYLADSNSTMTDAEGRFEFFTVPGNIRITSMPFLPSSRTAAEHSFSLTDRINQELELHVDAPDEATLLVKTVTAMEPPTPLPKCDLRIASTGTAFPWEGTSDANGELTVSRSRDSVAIVARSADRTQAVVVMAAADQDSIDVTLRPAAVLAGRLIDDKTGDPVVGMGIAVNVAWDLEHLNFSFDRTHSDEQGRFQITGLATDADYELVIEPKDKAPGASTTYKAHRRERPTKSGEHDLGDWKIPQFTKE